MANDISNGNKNNKKSRASDIQRAIIQAVDNEVNKKLNKYKTTSSKIGVVMEDPRGYEAKVMIGRNEMTCKVPEHLHTWIQEDDVVIVQDLYSNGSQKIITGKTGERRESPSLVFEDPEIGRNISGRDAMFDESGNKLDGYGTV